MNTGSPLMITLMEYKLHFILICVRYRILRAGFAKKSNLITQNAEVSFNLFFQLRVN